MADRNASSTSGGVGHPAPGRHRVGDLLLCFSFVLVPAAWIIQLGAISSLAGLACLAPDGAPTGWTPIAWSGPAIRWINGGAILLAVAGVALTLLNMHRSHEAAAPPSGGVVKSGEGRVHWMALGGFFVALVTMIAVVANSIPVYLGGMCPV